MNENDKDKAIGKPLVVSVHEFESKISDVINNSGIPVCIIEKILKDLYTQVHNASLAEYREALNYYETNKEIKE